MNFTSVNWHAVLEKMKGSEWSDHCFCVNMEGSALQQSATAEWCPALCW